MQTVKKNPQRYSLPDPSGSPFPHNDRQFFQMFGTEEQCQDHLHNQRWPDGFVCRFCGETNAWWLASSEQYKCANGHKTSLTAGTAMQKTRHPLTDWYYAAWLLCSHAQGVSALQLMRKCESLSHNGIWGLLHKLRASLYSQSDEKLCGNVEVDEMYIGGKETGPGVRGRGAVRKALVAVAVEFEVKENNKGEEYVECKQCRMRVIPNAQANTLLGFISANIERGSTICTDALTSYRGLESIGYSHGVTVAGMSADPLPAVGRVTTNLKRWIAGILRYAIRKQHVQAYLNEWAFRFNHRYDPWTMFHTALGLMAENQRGPTYRGLSNRTWIHRNPSLDELDIID
jgi:transposase-like protein